jgi:hypothetical protein
MATLQDILTGSPVSRQDSPYKGKIEYFIFDALGR